MRRKSALQERTKKLKKSIYAIETDIVRLNDLLKYAPANIPSYKAESWKKEKDSLETVLRESKERLQELESLLDEIYKNEGTENDDQDAES